MKLEWHPVTGCIVDADTQEVLARDLVRIDGERIVRAVNSHARLLEALKETIAACPTCKGTGITKRKTNGYGAGDFPCRTAWCHQARAAIKLAEETS